MMTAPGSSRDFDFAPTRSRDGVAARRVELRAPTGTRLRRGPRRQPSAARGRAARRAVIRSSRRRSTAPTRARPGAPARPRPSSSTPWAPPRRWCSIRHAGRRAAVVHLHDGTRSRLRIAVHHAVADGRGLLVLLDDLRALYAASASSERPVVDVDWSDRTIGALLDRDPSAPRIVSAWVGTRRSDGWCVPRPIATMPANRATTSRPSRRATGPTRFESAHLEAVEAGGVGARAGGAITCSWRCSPGRGSTPSGTPAVPSVSGWLVTVDCRRQLGVSRRRGQPERARAGRACSTWSRRACRTRWTRLVTRSCRSGGPARAWSPTSRPAQVRPVPGPLVDRAMRGAFDLRAATDRYTRFDSHVDVFPEIARGVGRRGDGRRAAGGRTRRVRAAVRRAAPHHVSCHDHAAPSSPRPPCSRPHVRVGSRRATELLGELADVMSARVAVLTRLVGHRDATGRLPRCPHHAASRSSAEGSPASPPRGSSAGPSSAATSGRSPCTSAAGGSAGRARAAAAPTGGSRSTASTCGSATTRTRSGWCASATPSSTGPAPTPTRPIVRWDDAFRPASTHRARRAARRRVAALARPGSARTTPAPASPDADARR